MMKPCKIGIALTLAIGLSACASTQKAPLYDPASRPSARPRGSMAPDELAPLSLRVRRVIVEVPDSLKVSEKNSYLPKGDIVWREDPMGDRHAQVRAIVQAAIEQGVAALQGIHEVDLHIEVTKFHALSEKARYTTGGVHAIQFFLTLLDPQTGAPLGEPRFVKADFDGLGGSAAIEAEARGITQKVRITAQLAKVIQTELTDPEGYTAEAHGLIAAMNQL